MEKIDPVKVITDFLTFCDDQKWGCLLAVDIPGTDGGMVSACGSFEQLACLHLKASQLAMNNFQLPQSPNHRPVFQTREERDLQAGLKGSKQ